MKQDYEIKTGDIDPGEENIIEKQRAIQTLYKASFPALLGKASRFFPGDIQGQQDSIHDFFLKKICPKSIRRLKEIEKIGPSYMIAMFKNYLIDIHRKRAREREEVERYIEREKSNNHIAKSMDWIPIEERVGIVIRKHKKAIAENFRNKQYPEVYELMIQGYTNPQISERLDIKASTVGTARHRIQKFLRNKGH